MTVPGSGYRFAAQIRETTDQGKEASELVVSRNSWSRVAVEEQEEVAACRRLWPFIAVSAIVAVMLAVGVFFHPSGSAAVREGHHRAG